MSLVTPSQKCNTELSQKGACEVTANSLHDAFKQFTERKTRAGMKDGNGKTFHRSMKVVVDSIFRCVEFWTFTELIQEEINKGSIVQAI